MNHAPKPVSDKTTDKKAESARTPFKMPLILTFALWLGVLLLGFGCASTNVNPPTAKPNTGYVDFSAGGNQGLAWEVQKFEAATSQYKAVYSQVEPVKDGMLRLTFSPGTHRLLVTFLNRAVEKPAEIEVNVLNGQITPVQITLTEGGTVSVQTRQDIMGPGARGYTGRKYKFGSYDTKSYTLTAAAQAPKPYAPKATAKKD